MQFPVDLSAGAWELVEHMPSKTKNRTALEQWAANDAHAYTTEQWRNIESRIGEEHMFAEQDAALIAYRDEVAAGLKDVERKLLRVAGDPPFDCYSSMSEDGVLTGLIRLGRLGLIHADFRICVYELTDFGREIARLVRDDAI